MTGCWTVATAIVRRAEVGAALQYLARDSDVWLPRVITCLLLPSTRIDGNTAGFRGIVGMAVRPPVTRPLPDISDHVVEAVAVGRKGTNRRGPLVTVGP